MTTHGSVAASVRLAKERNPSAYCASPRCLFRTVDRTGQFTPCPKHPDAPKVIDLMQALRDSLKKDGAA